MAVGQSKAEDVFRGEGRGEQWHQNNTMIVERVEQNVHEAGFDQDRWQESPVEAVKRVVGVHIECVHGQVVGWQTDKRTTGARGRYRTRTQLTVTRRREIGPGVTCEMKRLKYLC